MPQFAVHGLAGDPVPGPQTSCRPYTRQPGKRAHLLLPVTAKAEGVGWRQNSPAGDKLAPCSASYGVLTSVGPSVEDAVFPNWLSPDRHTFWALKLCGSLWKILSLFKKLFLADQVVNCCF